LQKRNPKENGKAITDTSIVINPGPQGGEKVQPSAPVRMTRFLLVLVLGGLLTVLGLWSAYSAGFSNGEAAVLQGQDPKADQLSLIPAQYINKPAYAIIMDPNRQNSTTTQLLQKLLQQEQEHYKQLSIDLQPLKTD
jgi:hypothetical protein